MPRIPVPIKSCSACRRAYTLGEWSQLRLLDTARNELHGRTVETRACLCGDALDLDVTEPRELALTMDAHEYAELYPGSGRARDAIRAHAEESERRAERHRLAQTIALLLAPIVVAFMLHLLLRWAP